MVRAYFDPSLQPITRLQIVQRPLAALARIRYAVAMRTLQQAILVLCLIAACGAPVAAQTGQQPPEPDMADIFYRLDNGTLVPLERQQAAIKGGAHGFIVMSMKSASEFPGAKSPVRFKNGEKLEFIVRSAVPVSAVDPNTFYCLRKLKSKRKTRELVMMSGHISPVGGSTTMTPAEGMVPVDFTKFGTSSLKMTAGGLAPGEYAVGHPYGPAVFCFVVD